MIAFMLRHPFDNIPLSRLRWIFWPLLAVTLGLMVVMNFAGAPLVNPAAPQGIVTYELAGSADRAARILQSWDSGARLLAAFSLGLDYLFIPLYANTIALACIWAALSLRRPGWSLAWLGALLAWGLWLAGILDGIENAGLLIQMVHGPVTAWARLAFVCASVKFALIFLGLVYVFYSLAVRLARLARPPRRRPRPASRQP